MGLAKVASYEPKCQLHKIATTLCSSDPEQYDFEHFYTFGWSGKLCFKARLQAAQELYNALCELERHYQNAYGVKPRFRIITHSHGGNVALNLANVQEPDKPLEIDELILLACPVQCATKSSVTADCFVKVYSFYSSVDMFQVIDPQGLYKERSENTFSQRQFDHGEKLRQAKIKINGRSLMHIDFIFTTFIKHLPQLSKEIDHLYEIVIPSQVSWPKQLDIRTKKGQSNVRSKILAIN